MKKLLSLSLLLTAFLLQCYSQIFVDNPVDEGDGITIVDSANHLVGFPLDLTDKEDGSLIQYDLVDGIWYAVDNPNYGSETANRNIYISLATGNDTTGDGSSGNKWRTLDKALSEVEHDISEYTITIWLDTGHYVINNYYKFKRGVNGILRLYGTNIVKASGITFTQVTSDPHCFLMSQTFGSNDLREDWFAAGTAIAQVPIYKNNQDTVWAEPAYTTGTKYILTLGTYIDDFICQKIDYEGSGRQVINFRNIHFNLNTTTGTEYYYSNNSGTEAKFNFCNIDNGNNSALTFEPSGSQFFNLSRVISNNASFGMNINKTTNDRFWWGISVLDNHISSSGSCFHGKGNNITLSGGAFLNADAAFDDADGNFASFFFNKSSTAGQRYWFDNIDHLFEISNSVLYFFDNDVGSQVDFTLANVNYLVEDEDIGVTPTNIQLLIDANKNLDFNIGITSTIEHLIDLDNNVKISWQGVTTDTNYFKNQVRIDSCLEVKCGLKVNTDCGPNDIEFYADSGDLSLGYDNSDDVWYLRDELINGDPDSTTGSAGLGSINLICENNGGKGSLHFHNFSDAGGTRGMTNFRTATGGTYNNPLDLANFNSVWDLNFQGYHSGSWRTGASIRAVAASGFGTGSYPINLRFYTVPDGATSTVERFSLFPTGAEFNVSNDDYDFTGKKDVSGEWIHYDAGLDRIDFGSQVYMAGTGADAQIINVDAINGNDALSQVVFGTFKQKDNDGIGGWYDATGTFNTGYGAGTGQYYIEGNEIDLQGGVTYNLTTVNAATYDLVVTDYILHVTYTSTADVTSLTLPTAQAIEGRTIIIKDAGLNASINSITIDTEGSETIDGNATLILNSDGDSVSLYSDGSNWFIF